jgi:hypothetical protein
LPLLLEQFHRPQQPLIAQLDVEPHPPRADGPPRQEREPRSRDRGRDRDRDRGDRRRGKHGERRPRPDRGPRPSSHSRREPPSHNPPQPVVQDAKKTYTTVCLGLGRLDGLDEMDIQNILRRQGKTRMDDIGDIAMKDHESFINIGSGSLDNVLEADGKYFKSFELFIAKSPIPL